MKPIELFHMAGRSWVVNILLDSRDLWIGCYWNASIAEYGETRIDFYFCLVPMLVLNLIFYRKPRRLL